MISHDIHVAVCLFSPGLYRQWPCIGYGPTALSLPQHGHNEQPNEELTIEPTRKHKNKNKNKEQEQHQQYQQ
jgi:hypothetical protein